MISQGKLKQIIRRMSNQKNVPYEILYQNFFFEGFLKRLSLTKYKSKFVLKGGYLISSLIGIKERSTVDVDMTIQNYDVTEASLRTAVLEITNTKLEDNITFEISKVEDIRHEDKYNGYRFTLIARFYSIKFYIKLDFSTGDIITPNAQKKQIHLQISDEDIVLMSYPIETVLAEKIETILSRAELSTRMKDYYDIYSILIKDKDNLIIEDLKKAIQNTFIHRNSQSIFDNTSEILNQIKKSETLKERWETYKNDNLYVGQVTFYEVSVQVKELIILGF